MLRRLWAWWTGRCHGSCNIGLHRLVLLADRLHLDGVRSLWWCRWCDRVWLIRDYRDLPMHNSFEIEATAQCEDREASNKKIARNHPDPWPVGKKTHQ